MNGKKKAVEQVLVSLSWFPEIASNQASNYEKYSSTPQLPAAM